MSAPIRTSTITRKVPLATNEGVTIGSALDAAWGKLSDFEGWSSWVPGIREASLLSQGAPGRGARLRLQLAAGATEFTIAHWEPSRSLAVMRQSPLVNLAYVFELRGEDQHICYNATVELQCSGLARLVWFFIMAAQRRRCHSLLYSL